MRTLYDSIDLSRIPADAQMVAGYVGGRWATFDQLAGRFPHAVRVSIAVESSEDAQVLDVESGDARPQEAPGWVRRQRARGQAPTVYCSTATWPDVVAACRGAGVELPQWWEAHYDGVAELSPGSVAKQYMSDTARNLDVSVVADHWPGVDPPAPTEEEPMGTATLTPTGAGTWRVHPDGAVYTAGDAEYYGGYPDLPADEREGTRTFLAIERLGPAMSDGYVLIADDGAAYRFNATVWEHLHPAQK